MQAKLSQIQGNIKFMLIKEATGKTVHFSADIFNFMAVEAKIDRECAWVIHLNGRNKIIEKELISMGTVNASLVQPREVFRKAIISGSASIIVVHNHPSGDVTPSEADLHISQQLKDASEILGVPIHDFIIIGNTHFSFADERVGGFT